MLSMADTDLHRFLPVFAESGATVAFLVPTETGFKKSIMDATAPIRELFKESSVHDYESQIQGPDNKAVIKTYLVNSDSLTETKTSLYRPVTKQGDPRIWIYNLKNYCVPYNLLALIIINKELYVFNLSNTEIANSLLSKEYCYDFLLQSVEDSQAIAMELLAKLREIHLLGFLPSITKGDPGVGDTLEHALGIERNNSKQPDYKGIELKATRITRNGTKKAKTRSTLFTIVPDEGLSYRQIIDTYGKVQTPRGQTEPRMQLYETFRCSRSNAYDLKLEVDSNSGRLNMLHEESQLDKYVAGWKLENLQQALLLKHHETFWVKALSETHDNWEYFRYDRVLHTKNPNISLLGPLLEADKITVDLAAHYKPDGKWRDHGILFKMMPEDLPLLLGEPKEYIL